MYLWKIIFIYRQTASSVFTVLIPMVLRDHEMYNPCSPPLHFISHTPALDPPDPNQRLKLGILGKRRIMSCAGEYAATECKRENEEGGGCVWIRKGDSVRARARGILKPIIIVTTTTCARSFNSLFLHFQSFFRILSQGGNATCKPLPYFQLSYISSTTSVTHSSRCFSNEPARSSFARGV